MFAKTVNVFVILLQLVLLICAQVHYADKDTTVKMETALLKLDFVGLSYALKVIHVKTDDVYHNKSIPVLQ